MIRDPLSLNHPLPLPPSMHFPSFPIPSTSSSSSTITTSPTPIRRIPSVRSSEPKGRPRSSSRNDLFSMDWGTGSVTPPKADSSFAVNKKDLGDSRGGYGERYRVSSAGAMLQQMAVTDKEKGSVEIMTGRLPVVKPISLEESPTIASNTPTRQPVQQSRTFPTPLVPAPIKIRIPKSDVVEPPDWGQPREAVDLRMDASSRRTRLGEGRYASVYAGRYRRSVNKDAEESELSSTGWNICAVKGFAGDADGWEMAVREKGILTRVNGSDGEDGGHRRGREYMVGLLGFTDESAVEEEEDLDELLEMAGLSFAVSVNASPAVSRAGSLRAKQTGAVLDGGSADRYYGGSLGRVAARRLSTEMQSRMDEFGVPLSPPPFNLNIANALLSPKSPRSPPSQSRYTMPRPLLMLEYLPGGTMEKVIKQNAKTIGAELWRKWLQQSLEALEWLEVRGIVHCDIKPANILLDLELNIRLADFSSALIVDPQKPPHDGVGRGTTAYSSPEILDPSIDITFSFPADLFSLGVTLYSCLTGLDPYKGLRTVELMWNVRKGRFWEWEERARLERVGMMPISPDDGFKFEVEAGDGWGEKDGEFEGDAGGGDDEEAGETEVAEDGVE